MTLLADSDLLQVIASQAANRGRGFPERDQALLELAKRHAQSMYHLARHILGDGALAEDAVQNALIGIWKRAGSFDSNKGASKPWILKILAHQALRMRRQASRKLASSAKWRLDPARAGAADQVCALGAAGSAEDSEVLGRLRESVASLPERDRLLVVLYYGAGLTQSEIARTLKLPQTSVSRWLECIVGQLRRDLKRLGFAVVFQPDEMLNAAICSGSQAPRNLAEAVLGRHSRDPRQPLAGTGKSAQSLWGLGAGVLLALAAGAAVWELGRSQVQAPDGSPNRPPVTAAVALPKAEAPGEIPPQRGFSRSWDFNQPGDYPGIVQLEGNGFRRLPASGIGNSGCLETVKDRTVFGLETGTAKLPLRVAMDLCYTKVYSKERYWVNNNPSANTSIRNPEISVRAFGLAYNWFTLGRWAKVEIQVTSRFTTQLNEMGQIHTLGLFEGDPLKSGRLEIIMTGLARIDNLELQEATPDRIPDIGPILEAIERIPSAQRQGLLPLPPFPGMRPGTSPFVGFKEVESGGRP